jgi:hypothetical protein
MSGQAKLLTLQFLHWIATRPRTHAELQEAWQSTCPLNCAWEDAIADGLVAYGHDGRIALTERGHAVISVTASASRSKLVPARHDGPGSLRRIRSSQ